MRSYLELVRCFLAPTAAADSWTGFFLARWLVGGAAAGALRGPEVGRLVLVMLVSILLYSVGMVTNDVCDIEKDRRQHRDRPLVRGTVTPARALCLAVAMTGLAVACAWLVGALAPALYLVAAMLAYNGGGKRIPGLGNLLMGSCRSLNLLLGAAAAGDLGLVGLLLEPRLAFAASILGLYIASVTAVSLLEDRPYRRGTLLAAQLGLLLAPITLVAAGWRHAGAWTNGIVFAIHLARGLASSPRKAGPNLEPHPAEFVVRRGLAGIYFVDAGLLWVAGLLWPALGVYVLLAMGVLLRRWWFRTVGG